MTTQFTLSPLWAILQNQGSKVLDVYKRQQDFYAKPPETIDKITKINSSMNSQLTGDIIGEAPSTYDVSNGVAIMAIEGMIIPKSDLFSLFFGGFAALDILTRDFTEMMGRDDIHTIVLDIDSPGGNAFGVQQFANLVYEARDKKNIIAVTSGMMASAAMWIGAAAHKVFITGDVTVVGSIGTVTTHVDISEYEKNLGVKTTEVAAGEFKREPSMFAPLSEKGRGVLQSQVDHANQAFINDIALFRGVSATVVKNKMAEGKTFIGTQALKVGLIDGKATMDSVVSVDPEGVSFLNSVTSNFNNFIGGQGMDILEQIADMKKNNIALYNAVFEEGKKIVSADHEAALETAKVENYDGGHKAGKAEGIAAGQKSEQERVSGLRELSNAGNADQIDKFIADGKTTAPDAAIEILKAQKVTADKALGDLAKNSPDAVNADASSTEDQTTGEKGQKQLVAEYMAEHKCSKGKAIQACAKLYPDAKNDFVQIVKKKAY